MSRFLYRDSIVLALAVAFLVMPSLALADVLEVSVGGARWVSGGPVGVGSGVPVAAVAVSGASYETLASSTAGPDRWRGKVGELSARYDVSAALLEALVWQESRWREGAVSPVGARGLAQLMPGTARMLGVDAGDPAANLEGGARYLRAQLDTFGGDVEKALAAYNAGPGRVARAGGVPAIRETQDYVAAILARLSGSVRR